VIIITLVALANLLEPHCPAMEFVDLRLGATLVGATIIEELELRPYSLSFIPSFIIESPTIDPYCVYIHSLLL
jgi:hypothetical protein